MRRPLSVITIAVVLAATAFLLSFVWAQQRNRLSLAARTIQIRDRHADYKLQADEPAVLVQFKLVLHNPSAHQLDGKLRMKCRFKLDKLSKDFLSALYIKDPYAGHSLNVDQYFASEPYHAEILRKSYDAFVRMKAGEKIREDITLQATPTVQIPDYSVSANLNVSPGATAVVVATLEVPNRKAKFPLEVSLDGFEPTYSWYRVW